MRDTRRSRLVLLGLLTAAFALLTVDARAGTDSPLSGARGLAATVFGPVERVTTDTVNPVSDWISSLGQAHREHAEIQSLEAQNSELRSQLQDATLTAREQSQLGALLHLAGEGQYTIVPAQVIGIGPAQGFTWTVTIDAGSHDGITTDETVVNGDGIVGRVVTVGPMEATVLLAIDPGFSVGTRMEANLEVGLTSGQGNQPMKLQLLGSQAVVQPGDRLVTLGSQNDRPFVPGVPVGTVQSVEVTPGELTRTALVTPFVDYTSLDIVGVVVQPPRTDPRNAVLPPLPTPTPAVPAPASTTPAVAGRSSATPTPRRS